MDGESTRSLIYFTDPVVAIHRRLRIRHGILTPTDGTRDFLPKFSVLVVCSSIEVRPLFRTGSRVSPMLGSPTGTGDPT